MPSYMAEGSVRDLPLIVIITLIAAITLVISIYLADIIQVQNVNGVQIFSGVFGFVQSALNVFTTGIVLVFVAMNLLVIAAASRVKEHPLLALASFAILIMSLVIVNVSVNIFQSFIQMSAFSAIGNNNIGAIVFIFRIMPVAFIIFGLILILFQYGKPSEGDRV